MCMCMCVVAHKKGQVKAPGPDQTAEGSSQGSDPENLDLGGVSDPSCMCR